MKIESITLCGFEFPVALFGELRSEVLANQLMNTPNPEKVWGADEAIMEKIRALATPEGDEAGVCRGMSPNIYDILSGTTVQIVVSNISILEAYALKRYASGQYSEVETYLRDTEEFPYDAELNKSIDKLIDISRRMDEDSDIPVKPEALLLPAKCLEKKVSVVFSGKTIERVTGRYDNFQSPTVFNKLYLNSLVGRWMDQSIEDILMNEFYRGLYTEFENLFDESHAYAAGYIWNQYYHPFIESTEKVNLIKVTSAYGEIDFTSDAYAESMGSIVEMRKVLCSNDYEAIPMREATSDTAYIYYSCVTSFYEFLELFNHIPMESFMHIMAFHSLPDNTDFIMDAGMSMYTARVTSRMKNYITAVSEHAPKSPDRYNLILLNNKIRFILKFRITDIIEGRVLGPLMATIKNNGFSAEGKVNYLSDELEAFISSIEASTHELAAFILDVQPSDNTPTE